MGTQYGGIARSAVVMGDEGYAEVSCQCWLYQGGCGHVSSDVLFVADLTNGRCLLWSHLLAILSLHTRSQICSIYDSTFSKHAEGACCFFLYYCQYLHCFLMCIKNAPQGKTDRSCKRCAICLQAI